MIKQGKENKSTKIVIYFYEKCAKGKREGEVIETNQFGKMIKGSRYPFDYLHQIPTVLEKILGARKIDLTQR